MKATPLLATSVCFIVASMTLAGCSDASASSGEPAAMPSDGTSDTSGALQAAEAAACKLDFKATLQKHLDAIQHHDLAAMEQTLTRDDALYLFFPNGSVLKTRQEFLDWHREWFAGTTWTMRSTPVRAVCTDSMAIAAFHNHYEDTDGPDGKLYVSESYLTLTFARQQGHWGLVHDQNTRIPLE